MITWNLVEKVGIPKVINNRIYKLNPSYLVPNPTKGPIAQATWSSFVTTYLATLEAHLLQYDRLSFQRIGLHQFGIDTTINMVWIDVFFEYHPYYYERRVHFKY